jgi:hypothetical protein
MEVHPFQTPSSVPPCPYTLRLRVFHLCCARGERQWHDAKTTRTHGPLYSSSIRPSQQDSLLYTQFFRTYPSSIHSIHCGLTYHFI